MFYYPLSAVTLVGDRLCPFRLEDGPCAIDNKTFVLQNIANSPILRYDGIYWSTLVEDYYEGDLLEVADEIYVVTYSEGFIAVSDNRRLRLADLPRPAKKVGHVFRDANKHYITRKRTSYKSGDVLWSIRQVIGANAEGVFLNHSGMGFVPYSNIQQYSGVNYKGTKLYFGDIVKGQRLHLINGDCCLNNITLKEKKYYD